MDEPLPVTDADAVVLGAGAFGVSTAFHLATLGLKRVVVLDRFAPASQTSPRAAGLFKLVQVDETLTRLAQLSIEIVTGFETATGVPMSHVRSGSLLIARTAEHAAMVDAEAVNARAWGIELEPVGETAAHHLAPYLEGRGLRTAYHVPGDIYVEEPATMLAAYLEAAARRGVAVVGYAPATALRVRDGRVEGVATPRGEIRTEVVVDAAGAWAPQIGAMGGVRVPVAPVRHQLLITEPLAGVAAEQPIVRITDASAYVRPARGGLMMGGFERDPLPLDPRHAAPDFTMDQIPLDRRVLDRFAASLADQVPTLPNAATNEHRGGLFTMTADGRFLAGPVPGLDGFWLATGCNGSGFSLSSGLGRCLAEWIVGGSPPFDLSTLHPGRFAGANLGDDALVAAGVWQYANYYTPAKVSA